MILRRFPSLIRLRTLHRVTLAAVCLATSIVLAPTSLVRAASYQVASSGYCDTSSFQSRGTSTLSWSGYFFLSSGRTYGFLYRYNSVGGGLIVDNGEVSAGGVNNNATVNNYGSPSNFEWQEVGDHTSTFFSGTLYSQSSYWIC